MRWQRISSILLFVVWAIIANAQWTQGDSVAYQPQGNNYLIYQRNSSGRWQLHRVISAEEYLRERERALNFSRFYLLNHPLNKPKKESPALNFQANGHLRLNLDNNTITDDNPMLPNQLRKRSFVTFKQESNVHLQAGYGERVKLDVLYNTETALATQRRRLKLQYQGNQHDFIQRIQAGNVRMDSRNALINTGQELFGLRGDFLLGPLSLQVIASRQHSEERRIVVQGGRKLRYIEHKSSDYDFAQHFFLSEFFAQQYDRALASLPRVSSDLYIDRIEVWVTSIPYSNLPPEVEGISVYPEAAMMADAPLDNRLMTSDTPFYLSSVQRLSPSLYTLNPTLGYLSLHTPLAEGQMLAVIYSYTYMGKSYQVGDFQVSGGERKALLISGKDKSPHAPLWPLMMKNAYSIQHSSTALTPEQLSVELLLKDPSTGLEKSFAESGSALGKSWLEIFGWDRSDASGYQSEPDGRFDLVDGITYSNSSRTLFLPYRYPFQTVPEQLDGNSSTIPIFAQLYSSLPREAKRAAALDRFVIRCQVSGASTQMISLDSRELLPGSVKVLRGGQELEEGTDYTINYATGYLTLSSESNQRIEVIIQEQERSKRKEKSMVGSELNWNPLRGLNIGATWLSYWENNQRGKVRWGEESLRNMMWGLHAQYSGESMEVTRWLNGWSGLELRDPSALSFQLSYAQLHSEYNLPEGNNQIIIEDFEKGAQWIDLTYAKNWQLGSLPSPSKRAQMAWFNIDPLLVSDGAAHQPEHLRQDSKQRAHPLVRQVKTQELFPNRDPNPLMPSLLMLLNLSYYPQERGAYNADPSLISASGSTRSPSTLWGSMMTSLPIQDLESSQYSYIEAWILDPFSVGLTSQGSLYIDLGKLKEDILPDNAISYEGPEKKKESEWGKASLLPPLRYGFDHMGKIPLDQQDTGLDGIQSHEEKLLPKYQKYLREIELTSGFEPWRDTPFGNPMNDPAGDDYHFFLGEEWDKAQSSILERYKYINGLEGNALQQMIQGISSAYTWLPDTEDTDRDLTQIEEESFFRYKLQITPMGLSRNNPQVVGERILNNGERWVKIHIPLRSPQESIGSSPSLQDARSIRLSLTGFDQTIHLRIAQLRLVPTAWSHFDAPIDSDDRRSAQLQLATLGLEEDRDRQPIPYISPPGTDREVRQEAISLVRNDEQALALQFSHLEPEQAVAVYQEFSLDLRNYERLRLFSHLHSFSNLTIGDAELFIRLGQDYTDNFYEYSIPLTPTLMSDFSTMSDWQLKQEIWKSENILSVSLEEFTGLKIRRNESGIDPSKLFRVNSNEQPTHHIAVKGHPTLGDVTSILIGVRNRSQLRLEGEVWVNELSVSGAKDLGGRAFQGSLQANLAELISLEVDKVYRSAKFGNIGEDVSKSEGRSLDSWYVKTQLQAGTLFPDSWRLTAPIKYSWSMSRSNPLYDPFASDLYYTPATKGQSVRMNQVKMIEIPHLFADPKQEREKFYHLNHLHFRYSLFRQRSHSPEIPSEFKRHLQSELSYSYEPNVRSFYRWSSRWDRLFHYQEHQGRVQNAALITLLNRWDWERSLNIQQQIVPNLELKFGSNTWAWVGNLQGEGKRPTSEDATFQVFNREVLRSLWSLGTTMRYGNSLEVSYQIPIIKHPFWQGLRGQLSWQSNYRWQRGRTVAGMQQGHRIENNAHLNLLLRYDRPVGETKKSPSVFQSIALHYRLTSGSALPGWLPTAGKVLGIGKLGEKWIPSVSYYFGLDAHRPTLEKIQKNGWIAESQSPYQPLSYFSRQEIDASLTIVPFSGFQMILSWMGHGYDYHQLHTRGEESRWLHGGSRRFSIWSRGGRVALDIDALEESFYRQKVLGGRFHNGLPSFWSMLPSVDLSYQLSKLTPWVQQHFSEIQLHHRYLAFADLPNYYLRPNAEKPELISLTISEEYNPLIGVSLASKGGLKLEESLVLRKSATLLATSQRLLDQQDRELSSAVSYALKFKPLFRSKIKLLDSFEQSFTLQLMHRYIYTLIHTQNILRDSRIATQGAKRYVLQFSADYKLSDAMSVKGFYQLQNQAPLVANYITPLRQTSYGVILNIQLQ